MSAFSKLCLPSTNTSYGVLPISSCYENDPNIQFMLIFMWTVCVCVCIFSDSLLVDLVDSRVVDNVSITQSYGNVHRKKKICFNSMLTMGFLTTSIPHKIGFDSISSLLLVNDMFLLIQTAIPLKTYFRFPRRVLTASLACMSIVYPDLSYFTLCYVQIKLF